MYGDNFTRFRLSAIVPFVFSAISFALVIVLVLSGTQPNSIPNSYLLSFNTTSVGQNLIQFNPANPATTTPAVNAARDLRSTLLKIVTNQLTPSDSAASSSKNTTNSTSSHSSLPSLNSSLPSSSSLNVSISTTSNPSSNSTVPTLAIPQSAAPSNPAAIPILIVGTFFQSTLDTLVTGGQTLQAVKSLLVTNSKQSFGVKQYYTMHLTGICESSILQTNATNSSSPFNITSCLSYGGVGNYIANLTSNVSDSTLIAATNITIPFLGKTSGIGKSVKSLIDTATGITLTVFIFILIGNGLSIFLSVASFILPSSSKIPTIAASITTISTQLLQISAITSTTIAVGISSSINNFSDVSGLRATVGGKFLALIWVGYVAAQIANGYWIATWFVEYRTVAYKARRRTEWEMKAGYKGIRKEVWSDLRLREVENEDDMEVLTIGMNMKRMDAEYNRF